MAVASSSFYKNKPNDVIWWVDDPETTGAFEFSFDRVTVFNLFADYPQALTQEQKDIFDRENPQWAKLLSERG